MTWRPSVAPSCPPRLAHRPPGAVGSLGPEAVELARECGLELDDWQAWYLECCLAFDRAGKWVSMENGLCMPRQNGKGAIIEARMLAGLFLLEEPLLTYTAHQFKTAQEHFLRIRSLIEGAPPWITKKVARARKAAGAEAIELRSGQRLRFLARGGGSARGFSGDVIFLDEAMALWMAMVGDLLPTMSARGDVTAGGPQVYYFGSAGQGEQALVFGGVRDRAIAGEARRLFYAEWAAGAPDDHTGRKVDLDDRAEWRRANPGMGSGRLSEDFTEAEREAMDDDQFGRERLGVWGNSITTPVIDADAWRTKALAEVPAGVKVAFALDEPPEGGAAALARAVELDNGRIVVEVDSRRGTLWAEERMAELAAKRKAPAVIDGGSRAGSHVPGVKKALGPRREDLLHVVGVSDLTKACAGFIDKFEAGDIYHAGQPELALAVDAARKRKVGDAWAFHRRDSSADISPLVAATLAVYGLQWAGKKTTGRSMAV